LISSEEKATADSSISDLSNKLKRLQISLGGATGVLGSTFVRWGRTSCPSNGTEMVYKGYVGGSHYTHTGAATDYLCLPEEPIWGHFEGASQSGAKVYGGEYQFDGRTRKNFFGKEVEQHDAPCVVCHTKRNSMLMIPGRNQCYEGWTLEYYGYLSAGHITHKAGSQYVCADAQLEVMPNSGANKNGKLFYFVEAKCGSLPCPPYVADRELSCVVCSK